MNFDIRDQISEIRISSDFRYLLSAFRFPPAFSLFEHIKHQIPDRRSPEHAEIWVGCDGTAAGVAAYLYIIYVSAHGSHNGTDRRQEVELGFLFLRCLRNIVWFFVCHVIS